MIARNYYHALGISPRADAECVKKTFSAGPRRPIQIPGAGSLSR